MFGWFTLSFRGDLFLVPAAKPPRFVALAMKRKHGDSDLTDLRKRAGELVARAGLENGEVKEQLVG